MLEYVLFVLGLLFLVKGIAAGVRRIKGVVGWLVLRRIGGGC